MLKSRKLSLKSNLHDLLLNNRAVIIFVCFCVIGIVTLLISFAATSTSDFEAESGTLQGNA